MPTATLPGGFTYTQLDILTLTPNSGPVGGGTNCTATGRGLDSVSTVVTLGNVPVDNLTIVSDTEITFDAPANTAGVVDLVVTQDTIYDILPNCFTYTAYKPSVNLITPSTGSEVGGTEITITGSNFDNTSTVTIDGNLCTDINVVSDTEITCITPAGTVGSQDVIITNSVSGYTVVNGFTYYSSALTLTGASVSTSLIAGGGDITVSGLNFTVDTDILIGSVQIENQTFINSKIITGTIPAQTAGTYNLTAIDGVNNNQLTDYFTYITSPLIISISPASGLPSGGTSVTVTGSGFAVDAVVSIGGISLTDQIVVNDTTITGKTPPNSTGTKDVIVSQDTLLGTLSDTLINGFSYQVEGYLGTQQIKSTFQQLLYVDGGITDENKPVQDAKGNYSPFNISTDSVEITKPVTISETLIV